MLSDLINKSNYVRMQKYAALVREINTGHVKTGAGKDKVPSIVWRMWSPFKSWTSKPNAVVLHAGGTQVRRGGGHPIPHGKTFELNVNGKLKEYQTKLDSSGKLQFYEVNNGAVGKAHVKDPKDILTALQRNRDVQMVTSASRYRERLGYQEGHARGAARGTLGTAGALGTGYLGLSYLGRDKEYTPNTPGTGGGTKEEGKDSLLPWLIGIPLLAGAGYGAYKLLSKKKKKDEDDSSED